jgi:hypothetical protein
MQCDVRIFNKFIYSCRVTAGTDYLLTSNQALETFLKNFIASRLPTGQEAANPCICSQRRGDANGCSIWRKNLKSLILLALPRPLDETVALSKNVAEYTGPKYII